MEDYINAGVTPSFRQVSQKRGLQTIEMMLGNIPDGSGKIVEYVAINAQKQLGDRVLATAKI